MSIYTIQSYRDSLELFLRFVAAHRRCEIEALNIKHFTATEVEEFLADLKRTRGNGTSTRNVRLAAVRIFARFVARQATQHSLELQRILEIPFRRGSQRIPLEYLHRG